MPSAVVALGNLAVAALIVERALAFIFEHEWFKRWTTNDDDSSRFPGLKGLFTITISLVISFGYGLDILGIVFDDPSHQTLGRILTGFVIAGGSSGVLAVFQGYLGMGKDSRDAIMQAKIAKAESDRKVADHSAKEAKARLDKAEAEKKLATQLLTAGQGAAG